MVLVPTDYAGAIPKPRDGRHAGRGEGGPRQALRGGQTRKMTVPRLTAEQRRALAMVATAGRCPVKRSAEMDTSTFGPAPFKTLAKGQSCI